MADPQFCFLAVDHWSTCMTKAEWSGWVQALGSITAILAGFGGVLYQLRAQERHQRSLQARQEFDQLSELRELILVGAGLLQEAHDAARTPAGYHAYMTETHASTKLLHTLELIRQTEVTAIPRAALQVAFRVSMEQLEGFYNTKGAAFQLLARGQADWESFTSEHLVRYASYAKALAESLGAFEAEIARLDRER